MKIQASIRRLYGEQLVKCEILKSKVDSLIQNKISSRWHYESRIKSDESFAIKVESGRFETPASLEDFFACLIVVRNATELAEAENLVRSLFSLQYRRPSDPNVKKNPPEDFRYDGIRLYVRLKEEPSLRPSPLNKITFEIQVKTFLMHAWDISSHDLVYKSEKPSWGVFRVAFQIRAMLEHADISITEIGNLARNSNLKVSTTEFDLVINIVDFLKRRWLEENLPSDLRHLAENIITLLKLCKIDLIKLDEIVDAETSSGRGTELKNLSPYGIIIKSIMNQEPISK